MYTQSITRTHRTAFIFVIDGSGSMAEKIRFRNRSGVERVNGHLHDAHGGRTVRVRGHAKVLLHLMLGLLVIAVEQSAQMLS